MSQTRIPRFALVAGARQFVRRLNRLAKDIAARVWGNLWLSSGLVVVVVGLGVGLSILLPWQFVPAPPPVTVEMALEALDSGHLEAARAMADELRLQTDLDQAGRGASSYILGVVLAGQIEREWRRKERAGLQTLAAGYLEEARQDGYPPGRAAEAELLLGKLYYHDGQFAQALPPLTNALPDLPQQASTIHRYLADAYLRSADPDWRQAQSHLEDLLQDDSLDAAARGRAALDLARALFEQEKVADCDRVLSQVQDGSAEYPEALMLRGRLIMREADALAPELPIAATAPPAALEKYQQAEEIFSRLVNQVARNKDLVRQARYLRGICLLRQGDHLAAEEQLVNLRRGSFNTQESLAAALAIAELQKSQGREEAVASLRSVMTQAGELDPYENRWISLTQLRKRLELVYQQYLDENQFDRALVIAEGLAGIVTPERSVVLAAEAERAWAEHLEAEASNARYSEKAGILAEAAEAWLHAGRLYERLARLRFSTRQFSDDVWESANCYFHGHDYHRTTKLLKVYMENETRRNRPPALTLLGEAQLALGKPQVALKWLTECIQFFPKNPHSYRARIVAAKANQELGNLDSAKQLLIGNLEHESLTPRSQEWRQSKYELGRILHYQGVDHEAKSRLKGVKLPNAAQRRDGLRELELARDAFQLCIQQLEEAVERDKLTKRDPWEKETLEARYFIAESHRQSAKYARRKGPTETIEPRIAAFALEMKSELNAAAEEYLKLQESLSRKKERFGLTPMEEQLLRNCYFARADALFDLKKYDQARKAYSNATNLYQHEPESLEAYVQIANCYRHENRPEDAFGTLELAKVVLERIPVDADFNKTTRYSRDEWAVLLNWLTAL